MCPKKVSTFTHYQHLKNTYGCVFLHHIKPHREIILWWLVPLYRGDCKTSMRHPTTVREWNRERYLSWEKVSLNNMIVKMSCHLPLAFGEGIRSCIHILSFMQSLFQLSWHKTEGVVTRINRNLNTVSLSYYLAKQSSAAKSIYL